MPLAEIESVIQSISAEPDATASANELLKLSEAVVEHWIVARGEKTNR